MIVKLSLDYKFRLSINVVCTVRDTPRPKNSSCFFSLRLSRSLSPTSLFVYTQICTCIFFFHLYVYTYAFLWYKSVFFRRFPLPFHYPSFTAVHNRHAGLRSPCVANDPDNPRSTDNRRTISQFYNVGNILPDFVIVLTRIYQFSAILTRPCSVGSVSDPDPWSWHMGGRRGGSGGSGPNQNFKTTVMAL